VAKAPPSPAWRRAHHRLDAYREELTRFIYQTGMFMRPVFNTAKARRNAWSTPKARTSACCAPCSSWLTKAWPRRS
jgi:hypothetical protein